MRGYIPGRFVRNTDFISNFGVSGLRMSPLPADPLCSAAPVPDPLALPGTVPTQMTHLTKAKTMRMALVLAQDPLTLTGCQGPLPAKPRTVLLEGRLGASGLANFELNGSLGGLRLSEGVDAEIVLKLVVKLDVVT